MTTMTTTCLFLVVAQGEAPMTRLLGLAQVSGQLSPRGTSKILNQQIYVSRTCLDVSLSSDSLTFSPSPCALL